MSEKIGTAAGVVWEYLRSNGTVTASQIQRGTSLNAAQTNQALGWLAREGKLTVARSQENRLTYALRE
jgi:hypothetical protein